MRRFWGSSWLRPTPQHASVAGFPALPAHPAVKVWHASGGTHNACMHLAAGGQTDIWSSTLAGQRGSSTVAQHMLRMHRACAAALSPAMIQHPSALQQHRRTWQGRHIGQLLQRRQEAAGLRLQGVQGAAREAQRGAALRCPATTAFGKEHSRIDPFEPVPSCQDVPAPSPLLLAAGAAAGARRTGGPERACLARSPGQSATHRAPPAEWGAAQQASSAQQGMGAHMADRCGTQFLHFMQAGAGCNTSPVPFRRPPALPLTCCRLGRPGPSGRLGSTGVPPLPVDSSCAACSCCFLAAFPRPAGSGAAGSGCEWRWRRPASGGGQQRRRRRQAAWRRCGAATVSSCWSAVRRAIACLHAWSACIAQGREPYTQNWRVLELGLCGSLQTGH